MWWSCPPYWHRGYNAQISLLLCSWLPLVVWISYHGAKSQDLCSGYLPQKSRRSNAKQVPQVKNCICNYNFKPHAFQATLNSIKMENSRIFCYVILFYWFFLIRILLAEKAGLKYVEMKKVEWKIDFLIWMENESRLGVEVAYFLSRPNSDKISTACFENRRSNPPSNSSKYKKGWNIFCLRKSRYKCLTLKRMAGLWVAFQKGAGTGAFWKTTRQTSPPL